MNIAILTLKLHTNYGGIIQAYALQKILEDMGHQVKILQPFETPYNKPIPLRLLAYFKRYIEKIILKKNIEVFYEKKEWEKRLFKRRNINKFIKDNIHRHYIKNLKLFSPKHYDAIIVGSDQVWRPLYFEEQWNCGICEAYLNFARKKRIKRIAYAASFGTDKWEYSDKDCELCGNLLKKFDYISVREKNAIKICKDKFNVVDISHVLDPTLLLSKIEYIKLINEAETPKSSGNLFCYILDNTEEKQLLVDKIAKERKLIPFFINYNKKHQSISYDQFVLPSVEQWLRGFMDAEFIVTDSFHACVFSIIFQKPFVVIGNIERGSDRFISLMSSLSLENNLIYSITEYDKNNDYTINEITFKQLDHCKRISMGFIYESLNIKNEKSIN